MLQLCQSRMHGINNDLIINILVPESSYTISLVCSSSCCLSRIQRQCIVIVIHKFTVFETVSQSGTKTISKNETAAYIAKGNINRPGSAAVGKPDCRNLLLKNTDSVIPRRKTKLIRGKKRKPSWQKLTVADSAELNQ